jgi:GxxExxY protein
MELLYKDECYPIIGACFDVYNEMGCGFLEPVYQECLGLEYGMRKIPALPHQQLRLSYKGQSLLQTYIPDFVCFGTIVLEIKAATKLADEHRAQVHNYLKATGLRLGLLVNFGHFPKLEYERIIR